MFRHNACGDASTCIGMLYIETSISHTTTTSPPTSPPHHHHINTIAQRQYQRKLQQAFDASQQGTYRESVHQWLASSWQAGMLQPAARPRIPEQASPHSALTHDLTATQAATHEVHVPHNASAATPCSNTPPPWPPTLASNPLLKLDAVLSQRVLQGPAPTGSPPLHQEATGLPLPTLQWVGRTASHIPPGFTAHPAVARLMEARR